MTEVHELPYQALETEKGGIAVYETAPRCVQHDELKDEWEKYLEQTQNHERVVLTLFEAFELDPDTETPGRHVVRYIGESLVRAMEMALESGDCRGGVRRRGRDQGPAQLGTAR